jgi:DNA-binding MarR family transcriptional regulator
MSKKNKKIIKEISWIKRGKQRREIIAQIKGVQTPSEIAKKTQYSLNNTSRIINEFKKHKIVKLLNPKDKTGRLYELTKYGKTIRDKIKENQK